MSRKYYENGKQIAAPLRLAPEYPAKERQRRIGGTVIVVFSYGADGKVTAASVKSSSGNRNLDNAALTAVRKWTIEPLKGETLTAGESETTLTFSP